MKVFQPADAREASQIITWAHAEREPLEIVGGGSKRRLGRPPRGHRLELGRLSGIIDYDHAELVLTARAATPMAEIQAELDARRQMLAFEPPDWRGLLGGGGAPTLGGALACNLAGPRRVRAGAARDHFLGLVAIDGRGGPWKSGGRVVKNVTGYDMCKLQAGAYGTLSVLTEVSVRVLPTPETSATVLLHGQSDAAAGAAMSRALNTAHEVSAAAHLPAAVAQRSAVPAIAGAGAVTALRLEGPEPSIRFRVDALQAAFEQASRIGAEDSMRLWAEIGAVAPLLPAGLPTGRHVWRLCPTPSAAPRVIEQVRADCPAAEAFYDWGGGLVWLALPNDPADTADAGTAVVRDAMRHAGGHATLVVAPDPTRAAVSVFEPEQGPIAALSARVKVAFDPVAVLNPGRVHPDR